MKTIMNLCVSFTSVRDSVTTWNLKEGLNIEYKLFDFEKIMKTIMNLCVSFISVRDSVTTWNLKEGLSIEYKLF